MTQFKVFNINTFHPSKHFLESEVCLIKYPKQKKHNDATPLTPFMFHRIWEEQLELKMEQCGTLTFKLESISI